VNMARSDESEPEDRDTVERDALLLAQTYTSQETKVGNGHCAILKACFYGGDPDLDFSAVLWIRDFYRGFEFFPSRIRIKEFKDFNPRNCFKALGNMIRGVHPGSGFFTHTGSRIRNTAFQPDVHILLGLDPCHFQQLIHERFSQNGLNKILIRQAMQIQIFT
jgi:hypothetical protein